MDAQYGIVCGLIQIIKLWPASYVRTNMMNNNFIFFCIKKKSSQHVVYAHQKKRKARSKNV